MARFGGGPSRRGTPGAGAALLELDPELGCLLSPERRTLATRELRVRVSAFPVGAWDGSRLTEADPAHYGLLIVNGVLAREVVLMDTVSTELLGPGDIMRPWHVEGPPELLPVVVRWNALSEVRIGLLDRAVSAQLGAYPEIGAVIVDRMSERAQRLAITQAISQLNRVDQRLLALFWHLAERWGRVAPNGISVPLALSHRLIGELVGARRPTVSTALAELAHESQLVRRQDGTWLLTGEPPEIASRRCRCRLPGRTMRRASGRGTSRRSSCRPRRCARGRSSCGLGATRAWISCAPPPATTTATAPPRRRAEPKLKGGLSPLGLRRLAGADDRRRGVCVDAVRLADLDVDEAGGGQGGLELGAREGAGDAAGPARHVGANGRIHVGIGEHVGDGDAAGRTDAAGRDQHVGAGAGAEVEHGLAGAQVGDGGRHAAASEAASAGSAASSPA
jgi:hypothetical protein